MLAVGAARLKVGGVFLVPFLFFILPMNCTAFPLMPKHLKYMVNKILTRHACIYVFAFEIFLRKYICSEASVFKQATRKAHERH